MPVVNPRTFDNILAKEERKQDQKHELKQGSHDHHKVKIDTNNNPFPEFQQKVNIESRSRIPSVEDSLSVSANQVQQFGGGDFNNNKLKTKDNIPAELAEVLAPCHQNIKDWVIKWVEVTKPKTVELCNGSKCEAKRLQQTLVDAGMLEPVPKLDNCWLACTDPGDVARVESKTVIATPKKETTIPDYAEGVVGRLGRWMHPDDLQKEIDSRFPGCMNGRTMYIIPFSMGPVGGSMSKCGIEITDSAYVALSMHTMTRVSDKVLNVIESNNGSFIKCMHSVGCPLPLTKPLVNNWPCNPEKVIVSHIPENDEIVSFGSGYGGNSLLGKKCFALRLGSALAQREGWMAEHMLISGITNPQGEKKYIAAAFPSACGKTNLAMMDPLLPGWQFECVGDDIAWLKFNDKGELRAINPENGFFGVAPGTSMETNPNAMKCCLKDTVFTNVAKTSDGNIWWEGMPMPAEDIEITTWKGEKWDRKTGKAAHPNSRFCTPAGNCPVISDVWEDGDGVPIDSIIFGGRRPEGVPLVYESYDWQHGVMVGASMRSEATAAAEHKGKMIMNDPMAMRPFFGYNFGNYLRHWFSLEKEGRAMPKIFHVNWFRKNADGKFIWPGFGENVRVLEWIFNRSGKSAYRGNASETAVGYVPKSLNLEGLKGEVDMEELFRLPKQFWIDEIAAFRKYLSEQVGKDTPQRIFDEINKLEVRVNNMMD